MEPNPRTLFGGSLAALIPEDWLDASDARPVPDHQEVWLEPDGDERCVVIELLERAECSDMACAEFHFHEIANGNHATKSTVLSSKSVPTESLHQSIRGSSSFVVHGVQAVPHDGSTHSTAGLHVHAAVIRLATHATDLLVSLSRLDSRSDGIAAQAMALGANLEDSELLIALVESLEVRDWSLFGESD